MRRGGFVGIQVATLLHGDSFPDLSLAGVGAWVRIRAASELTGEPISARAAERLGVGPDVLDELRTAGLLETVDDRLQAIGMPSPGKPSESPEQERERQEAHRLGIGVGELRARKAAPLPALSPVTNQINSTQESRGHRWAKAPLAECRCGRPRPRGARKCEACATPHCRGCGAEMATWSGGWCSPCRQRNRARKVARQSAQRRLQRSAPHPRRRCLGCEVEFVAGRRDQIFCGAACSKNFQRVRRLIASPGQKLVDMNPELLAAASRLHQLRKEIQHGQESPTAHLRRAQPSHG